MDLPPLDPDRPVLIAGPTGAGKSALALAVAEAGGRTVVNADALQVFADWRVLTARPAPAEEARVPHRLFGHVPGDRAYSVGHWLRDLAPVLAEDPRAVIVGGTGLYFAALTEGLAEIPPVPEAIRAAAEAAPPARLLDALDAESRARIDSANPARVRRAWAVLRATGRGLAAWQDATPPPLLPLARAEPLLIEAPRDWLAARLEARFDRMLAEGALEEARAHLDDWDPARPSSKAIGAAGLVAHLRGEMSLAEARAAAIAATRRYAKRQRSWFRARMRGWRRLPPP